MPLSTQGLHSPFPYPYPDAKLPFLPTHRAHLVYKVTEQIAKHYTFSPFISLESKAPFRLFLIWQSLPNDLIKKRKWASANGTQPIQQKYNQRYEPSQKIINDLFKGLVNYPAQKNTFTYNCPVHDKYSSRQIDPVWSWDWLQQIISHSKPAENEIRN